MQYSKIDFIERSLVTYNWSGIDKFGQHNYIYFFTYLAIIQQTFAVLFLSWNIL